MKKLPLPSGFFAAGIAAGLKKRGKDMALIVSETPAVSAAVFTTNQIKAAPVKWDVQVLEHEKARAIVINSGNANACTGKQGMADTEAMATFTAKRLEINPSEIFVCSTGPIGKPLPMGKIAVGIQSLSEQLSSENGMDVAEAVMTTDLVTKTVTAEMNLDGTTARITGLAKGSGMIEPNMATMLAFILTDVAIEKHTLQCALQAATNTSFNRITVDGDRSTNDTVICLANGTVGNSPITLNSNHRKLFFKTLEDLLFRLSMMIVQDGEGATRVVTIEVNGAASDDEADKAARAVANSMLNKTAWAGTHPNWGRVMDAIGYSCAQIQENQVDIDYDDVPAVRGGLAANASEERLIEVVSKDAFTIHIHLNLGMGHSVVYTCNCTEDYVRINVD